MKKVALLCIVLLFSFNFNAQKGVKVLAKNNQMVLKGKNSYTYLRLDPVKPTKISVKGPGKLKVIVRVKLKVGDLKSEAFNVKYISNNKKIAIKSIPGLTKSNKFSTKERWVTSSKEIIINVQPDKQNFTFILPEKSPNAYVYFSFKPDERLSWSERKSSNNLAETVKLVSDKNQKGFTYYRITDKIAFKDSIINSDYLKIIIRPEFKHSEFSELKIRFGVKINGEIVKTYTVNSKRSKVLRYKVNGKMIPGISDKIYFKIPNKNIVSNYEIVMLSSKKTALIRVKTSKKSTK